MTSPDRRRAIGTIRDRAANNSPSTACPDRSRALCAPASHTIDGGGRAAAGRAADGSRNVGG